MKRLVVFLVFLGAGVPESSILSAELNLPEVPVLEFKGSDRVVTWSRSIFNRNSHLVLPTVVTEFYVGGKVHNTVERLTEYARQVRNTPYWSKLSDDQLAFCRLHPFITATEPEAGTSLEGFSIMQILAVTEDDAEQIAKALIGVIARIDAKEQTDQAGWLKRRIAATEEGLSEADTQLPKSTSALGRVEQAYKASKVIERYSAWTVMDAWEAAKLTAQRVDEQLVELEIRIAEIRARLKIIEQYKDIDKPAIRDHLESMEVDLIIELTGLNARRDTIIKIEAEAKELRQLYTRRLALLERVKKLRKSIDSDGARNRQRREELSQVVSRGPQYALPQYVTICEAELRIRR